MKSKVHTFSSREVLALAFLLGFPFYAQAQELKAQAYIMTEYIVKPSMIKEFEATTIEENALFAGIQFPYGWSAFSTEDSYYYFLTPLGKDFASLDTLRAAFDEAELRLGKNCEALEKRMAESYEYYRDMVLYLRPDLSNTAPKSFVKPEEAGYVLFELTYILPGKEEEFEAFCKEWAALCQKIGYQIGYVAYSGGIGADMPFYLWAMSAEKQADTFAEGERLMKILSAEEQAELMATHGKGYSFFRKYETRHGRSRPDLSYTPKIK